MSFEFLHTCWPVCVCLLGTRDNELQSLDEDVLPELEQCGKLQVLMLKVGGRFESILPWLFPICTPVASPVHASKLPEAVLPFPV